MEQKKSDDYLKDFPDFVKIEYEKERFKSIKEEDVWNITAKMEALPEEERNLFLVDGEFYDQHIVNRFTGQWMAGDTIWVLACSDRTPLKYNYRPGLLARSVHILSDIYREKKQFNYKFGLVNVFTDELLKETIWGHPIAIVMLKNGRVYRDRAFLDAYHQVHEFIEVGHKHEKVFHDTPVGGRITTAGLYLTYFHRDLSVIVAEFQHQATEEFHKMDKEQEQYYELKLWFYENFIKLPSPTALMLTEIAIVVIVFLALTILYCMLRCICRCLRCCCCAKDTKPK